jgi:hypothetical protein
VFQSTLAAQVLTPKNKSTLVFHKNGNQYFLEQIWTGGEQERDAIARVSQRANYPAAISADSAEQYLWKSGEDRDGRHRRQLVLICKKGSTPVGAKMDYSHMAPTGAT